MQEDIIIQLNKKLNFFILSYILTTLDLDNTTNLSCVKILIRLARTSREVAERILSYPNLINGLVNQFAKSGDCR